MTESKRLFRRSLPEPVDHLIIAFYVFSFLATAVRVSIAIKTGKHAPGLAWASLVLSAFVVWNPLGALLFVIYRHLEGRFSTLDNTYIVFSVLSVGFFLIYVPFFWVVISPFGYQAWVASFNEDGVLAKRYKWWWKFILWA